MELLNVCKINNWEKPMVCQSAYSWIDRKIEETLIPVLASNNISLTPYRILEGGLLTGKYNQGNSGKESRLYRYPRWVSSFDQGSLKEIDEFISEAETLGLSPIQYSAKWLLIKNIIPSIVVGARTSDQINPFLSI